MWICFYVVITWYYTCSSVAIQQSVWSTRHLECAHISMTAHLINITLPFPWQHCNCQSWSKSQYLYCDKQGVICGRISVGV